MKSETVLLGLGLGAAVAAAIYFATRKPAGTTAPQSPAWSSSPAGGSSASAGASYASQQAPAAVSEPVRVMAAGEQPARTANASTYTSERPMQVIYTAPVIATQQPVRNNTVVPPRTDTTLREIVKAPTRSIQGLFGTHG